MLYRTCLPLVWINVGWKVPKTHHVANMEKKLFQAQLVLILQFLCVLVFLICENQLDLFCPLA